MAVQTVILPGEDVASSWLSGQANSSNTLKLGPGLRHVLPLAIISTVAGTVVVDQKKKAIWVENSNGKVSIAIMLGVFSGSRED